ncbi:MAG: hypothetical protein HY599_01900, partial [Candidatus Omnitrophica bacterium]|nr:hypothetical protein [Candidatus Omnitrophota bacterium]
MQALRGELRPAARRLARVLAVALAWLQCVPPSFAAPPAPNPAAAQVAPEVSIVSPADGTLTNATAVDVTVAFAAAKPHATPRAQGTVIRLELLVDGVVAATVTNPPQAKSGTQHFLAVDLSGGTNTGDPVLLTARAYQGDPKAGLFRESAPVAVLVDTRVPVISGVQPPDGAVLDDVRPALAATVTDAGGAGLDPSSLALLLDGSLVAADVTLLDPDTAAIQFIPAADLADGAHTVVIQAADRAGNPAAAQATFTILAGNQPPVLAPLGDQTAPVGSTLTFDVIAADPDGDPVTLAVAPVPLPANASFTLVTGTFQFTPEPAQVGSLSLAFSASDGQLTDSETVTITIPPLPGVTSLRGQVVTTGNAPLANVRLVLGTDTPLETVSQADGSYVFPAVPFAGRQRLLIDGSTVDPGLGVFATVPEQITLLAGADNVLTPPIVLLPLDAASADPIDPATTSIITSSPIVINGETFPPVTMTVQPGAAHLEDTGEPFAGLVHISQIPDPALGPRPMPEDITLSVYLAVQPFGVAYDPPAEVTFPNVDGFPVGSRVDIFGLNHDTGVFEKVGEGTVAGALVHSDGGVIRNNSWHGFVPPPPLLDTHEDTNETAQMTPRSCTTPQGSDVCVQSGDLAEDHRLVSHRSFGVSRAVRLVYHSAAADPRPVLTYESNLSPLTPDPATMSTTLTVGGVDEGIELFALPAPPEALPIRPAVQFDAARFPTGVYPYRLRVHCNFPVARRSERLEGQVIIQNAVASPLGAGWGVDALQRLHLQPDGTALLTDGGGEALVFQQPAVLQAEDFEERGCGFFLFPAPGLGFLRDWNISQGSIGLLCHGLGTGVPLNPPSQTVFAFGGNTRLESRRALNLIPGTYELRFEMATCQAGDPNTLTVSLGDAFSETFQPADATAFTPVVRTFAVAAPLQAPLVFESQFAGGNCAPFLDNVSLRALGPAIGFQSPDGDFSLLREEPDGSFTRTLKDGTRLTFDALGRQTAEIDRNGNATTYASDAQDRLAAITDPAGLVTTFTYTGGRLMRITDPAGRATQFLHDAQGNLLQITDPDGAVRTFAYAPGTHRLITQTNARGFQTHYTYDFAGRLVGVERAEGATREIQVSQTLGLIDPTGGDGTAANPAPPPPAVADIQTILTDGQGGVRQLTTDAFGAVTRQTDPLGRVTTISRSPDGLPLVIIQPELAGVTPTTGFTYDSVGNVLTVTEAGAGPPVSRFTYEPDFNQVTSLTDPNGHTTTLAYDAQGNPVEVTDALGTRTVLAYADPVCPGQLTAVTSAVGLPEETMTALAYDPGTCNLLETTDPLGRTTLLAYDTAGNVTRSTDAADRVTLFTYDPMNRLTTVQDAAGGLTRYTYDPQGNLTQVRDARAEATSFAYDPVDRLRATTNPLGQGTTFSYDPNGNLTEVLDPAGQRRTFTYDAAHHLTTKTLRDALGTVQDTVTFTSDVLGQLTEVADSDSRLRFEVDVRGQLVTAHTGEATNPALAQPVTTLSAEYDFGGNRSRLSDPTGTTEAASDPLNRLTVVGRSGSASVVFTYDALSRRVRTGFNTGLVDLEALYTYDAASQLLALIHQPVGGYVHGTSALGASSPGQGWAKGHPHAPGYRKTHGALLTSASASAMGIAQALYTYDAVGNRLSLTDLDGLHAFTYDGLSRLTGATHPALSGLGPETFAYDGVGNRTSSHLSTTHVYDAANRLLEDDTFTYTYDANGNLTTKTAKVGGAVTTYTYDVEDQLVGITTPSLTASYRYDGLGRRIEKDVDGLLTRYVYDNEDILLEYDGTNTLVARWLHGPGIDEPLVLERDLDHSGTFEATERFTYHADGLGSIVALTDSTGSVIERYRYDSFGQPTILAPDGTVLACSAMGNPFLFT